MNSRRDALKAIAVAAAATPALEAQHQHFQPSLTQIKTPPKPVFFKPDELAIVKDLADSIIPRTDTPGASDAGVHFLIDQTVSKRREAQRSWREGLALLKSNKFATMDHTGRTALLTRWSQEDKTKGSRFFRLVKDSVIDAYYSTKEGLTTELGWHGNTFLAEFKGCTHPEHQG